MVVGGSELPRRPRPYSGTCGILRWDEPAGNVMRSVFGHGLEQLSDSACVSVAIEELPGESQGGSSSPPPLLGNLSLEHSGHPLDDGRLARTLGALECDISTEVGVTSHGRSVARRSCVVLGASMRDLSGGNHFFARFSARRSDACSNVTLSIVSAFRNDTFVSPSVM